MRWADARGMIGNTHDGWNRHDCRKVWLVARIDKESDDQFWGNPIYLTASGEHNTYELDDPVLAFDSAREARMVAEYAEYDWHPINLYDLLCFEDGKRGRFKASEPFIKELTEAWQTIRRRRA